MPESHSVIHTMSSEVKTWYWEYGHLHWILRIVLAGNEQLMEVGSSVASCVGASVTVKHWVVRQMLLASHLSKIIFWGARLWFKLPLTEDLKASKPSDRGELHGGLPFASSCSLMRSQRFGESWTGILESQSWGEICYTVNFCDLWPDHFWNAESKVKM